MKGPMWHLSGVMVLALVACGQGKVKQTSGATPTTQGNASTSSTASKATDTTYLSDTVESAASDETAVADVDSSLAEDLKAKHLQELTAVLLKDLDADTSGNLSLEEFLAGPKKIGAKHPHLKELTEEQQAKIKEKLSAEFTKYAGDDALLSVDELTKLLAAQAPRVSFFRKHRGEKEMRPGFVGRGPEFGSHEQGFGGGRPGFPGGQQQGFHGPGMRMPAPPAPPSWEEILKKYDKDGNQSLNQEEFEAMIQDRPQP